MQLTSPDRAAATIGCVLLATLAVACAPTGSAVDREAEKRASFTRDEGPEARWREAEVVFPPYPREEHLAKVQISGPASFTFLVDTESIRVDDDGAVRYTLIARSATRIDNVSFEGMRCETGEYKTYALGSSDQTWSRVGISDWRQIQKQRTNDYRYDLNKFYFCPFGVPQRSSSDAVAAIRRGIPHPEGR